MARIKPARRFTSLLVGCLVCSAQQHEIPTFRTGTTLIEFTVVATDNKGQPVTDLKKEEILITEQGQPSGVAFFRFEGANVARQPKPLPPGAFSNRPEHAGGQPRNLAAITLDTINTAPVHSMVGPLRESTYQDTAREQIRRYLKSLPADTRAAVYKLESHQIRVLQDFTDDAKLLRARIEKMDLNDSGPTIDDGSGRSPPAGVSGAEAAAEAGAAFAHAEANYNATIRDDRLAQTLAGLETLGDHLAGMQGRKSIIWLSTGMPIRITSAGWPKSYAGAILKTAQRLASQGIAVYPVPAAPSKYNATMDVLAETTGGRVVRTMNDPAKGIMVAAADTAGSYTVGFYSTAEPDNKWRRVGVDVKRPGVKLTYRQGYLSEAPASEPQTWSGNQWRTAIYNTLGSTAIALDARCELKSGAETGNIHLALKFDLDKLVFRQINGQRNAEVEIAIAEMKPNGAYNLQRESAIIRDPASTVRSIQYTHNWKLDPQAVTLRLILRDKFSGSFGTLDLPVSQVPRTTTGGTK